MAALPTTWATIAEVSTLTGVTVDETALKLGASGVELHTGLIEALPMASTSARDFYWLKVATCYQAAWVSDQPDYLVRNAVQSSSQDGQSAQAGNPDWLTLGPLARKAIKRLSHNGTRSLEPQRSERLGRLDALLEVNDDRQSWQVYE